MAFTWNRLACQRARLLAGGSSLTVAPSSSGGSAAVRGVDHALLGPRNRPFRARRRRGSPGTDRRRATALSEIPVRARRAPARRPGIGASESSTAGFGLAQGPRQACNDVADAVAKSHRGRRRGDASTAQTARSSSECSEPSPPRSPTSQVARLRTQTAVLNSSGFSWAATATDPTLDPEASRLNLPRRGLAVQRDGGRGGHAAFGPVTTDPFRLRSGETTHPDGDDSTRASMATANVCITDVAVELTIDRAVGDRAIRDLAVERRSCAQRRRRSRVARQRGWSRECHAGSTAAPPRTATSEPVQP